MPPAGVRPAPGIAVGRPRPTREGTIGPMTRMQFAWDAILFDWDGTLCDSLGALFHANRAVMSALGLPFDEARYRRHFAGDWRLMYRSLGVPDERLEEAGSIWFRAYDGGRGAELFPGVSASLARLAGHGVPIGLVTAGHGDVVRAQLDRLGVGRTFAVTVFGEDAVRPKPDPAPLRLALERLGLASDAFRVAYLGDTADDMRMARASGAHPVGIVSAVSDAGVLRAAGAAEVAPGATAWIDRQLAPGPIHGRPAGVR
jgi:phosphoglycolate phosphatase